jgi:hypothetical protein
MKIAVSDLKKALAWIEANTREVNVRLELHHDGRNLSIKCEDKYQVQVEIKLFNDGTMQPRITKEDAL